MTETIKEKLINEVNQMSAFELEKIYKIFILIKNEFIDEGEARYYTKEWMEAENEATEVYKKGDLKSFSSVKALSDFIEDNIESNAFK